MENKFLSRKFGITVGTIIILTALVCVSKISQEIFSSLMMFIIGGYMASNVTQKYIEGGKDAKD